MVNRKQIEKEWTNIVEREKVIIYLYIKYLKLDIKTNILFNKNFIDKIENKFKQDKNWKKKYFIQKCNNSFIKEYINIFNSVNQNKKGNTMSCNLKMTRFMLKNPEISEKDIIEATKRYISETDINYIRQSHYFIEKGLGVNRISDLLEWVNKIKLEKEDRQKEIM